MPVTWAYRISLAIAWGYAGVRQIRQFLSAYRKCTTILIAADGYAALIGYGGTIRRARLLPGSLVLRRIAWLRLGPDSGPAYGELLVGDPGRSNCWRQLQVLWRHLGAAG